MFILLEFFLFPGMTRAFYPIEMRHLGCYKTLNLIQISDYSRSPLPLDHSMLGCHPLQTLGVKNILATDG